MCRQCAREEKIEATAEVGVFFFVVSAVLLCLGGAVWAAQDPQYHVDSVAWLPLTFGGAFMVFAALCGLRWLVLTFFRR